MGAAQGFRRSFQADAQLDGHAQHGQRIVHRELTGDTQLHHGVLLAVHSSKGNAVGLHFHIFGIQTGCTFHRSGDHGAGNGGAHPCKPGIVAIHHSPTAAAKQQCLGITVIFHGFMEIQMIFRQIGECRHIISHGIHSVKGKGMGRYFHHHMGAAGIPHPGKQCLQFKTLRRGALCGHYLLANEILHGADEAHLGALHSFQNMLQQQRRGGLAVGASDTHHGHGAGRMSEEIGADSGQSLTVGAYQNIGHAGLGLHSGDHNRSALFHGHGNKPIAVGGKTGDGNEHAADHHLAGIIGHILNIQLHIHIGF